MKEVVIVENVLQFDTGAVQNLFADGTSGRPEKATPSSSATTPPASEKVGGKANATRRARDQMQKLHRESRPEPSGPGPIPATPEGRPRRLRPTTKLNLPEQPPVQTPKRGASSWARRKHHRWEMKGAMSRRV